MTKCLYCDNDVKTDSEVCEYHEFALFQISEILTEFINNREPPEWLLSGLRELAWIFYGHPRTAAYVNTSMEIADTFVIERQTQTTIDEIDEVNYSRLPTEKILLLLEEALIIERDTDLILPGPLSLRLREIRDLGYALNSPELRNRSLEYHGILSLSLLRSLLLNRDYIPRAALSIMTLLSLQGLISNNIEQEVSLFVWDNAFISLPKRQENKMKRIMAGLLDGVTKVIEDINDDGRPLLKPSMIEYLQNMRERYRERERDRIRN